MMNDDEETMMRCDGQLSLLEDDAPAPTLAWCDGQLSLLEEA